MTTTPFGVPSSARRLAPMCSLQVRCGEKDPSTGYPRALDYFKVGTPGAKDSFKEHPSFAGKRVKEIEIELYSNNIGDMYRDKLSCYDSRSRFCSNDTGGGQAIRRNARGEFLPVECNPDACPMRQNNGKELLDVWAKLYPHIAFGKAKPGDRGIEYQTIKCKPETYFFFRILDPAGGYLTKPGEVARFYSSGETSNSQILAGLADIANSMSGNLVGLRCTLKLNMIKNPKFGNLVPTVGVIGPDSSEMMEALKGMAKRQRVDVTAVLASMGSLSDDELDKLDSNYIYSQHTRGTNPALPETDDSTPMLPARTDRVEIQFATQEDVARGIIGRLRFGQGAIGTLQMKYADNLDGLMKELIETAQKGEDGQPIGISDLLNKYGWVEYVEVPTVGDGENGAQAQPSVEEPTPSPDELLGARENKE